VQHFFENHATREWREHQEELAEDDETFIEEDTDSQDELRIDQGGLPVVTLRARVEFVAGTGWFISDRMGRRWAIDTEPEDESWTLDLGGRHAWERMQGVGWMREVPKL
jgi:hypothetical protein